VGDERLGVALEALLGDTGDVVAGREERRRPGDEDAAVLDPLVQLRQDLGDRVEDLVVEGVAALRVGDRQRATAAAGWSRRSLPPASRAST